MTSSSPRRLSPVASPGKGAWGMVVGATVVEVGGTVVVLDVVEDEVVVKTVEVV